MQDIAEFLYNPTIRVEAKKELLKRRVDLAARCVMKEEADACAEVELLPQLDTLLSR